jgi:effector-binding domain-containing protein
MPTRTLIQAEDVIVPPVLAVKTTCTCSLAEIPAATAAAFAALGAFLHAHRLASAGPPRSVYTGYTADETTFDVAMPIAANPGGVTDPTDTVVVTQLPAGPAWRFLHSGPYRTLPDTYGRITEWLRSRDLLVSEADWARFMPMWEEYLNDPQTTPESELRTFIYLPRR